MLTYLKVISVEEMVLYDRFGRPIRGARISLNSSSHCNFNCLFCHKEGIKDSNNYMSPEEIERIVRVLRRFGVEYIKLTGGEPMLRRDIVEIVSGIKGVGVKEISMTTNGTNLEKLAYKLKDAGLSRVNISLHSLKRDRYRFITKVDALDKTLRAINAAIDAGLLPVKLNIVLLKGINDDEIWDIIDYSYRLGGNKTNTVQFIELLNINEAVYEKYHVELDSIEARIKERAVDIRRRKLHNRPVYVWITEFKLSL